MERFLTLKYYFIPLPDPNFQFTKITLGIGLLLLLLGFALGYLRKKRIKDSITKKILKPYPGKLKLYGFFVLLLLVFREQGIPYLSMRLWWFILLGLFLYNAIKLAITYQKDYANREKKINKNKSNSKYLPKKKR